MKTTKTPLPPPSFVLNSLHIFTLTTLVIAYPLYAFLAANPAYFITNDIWPRTIYACIALISAGIPLALTLLLLPAYLLTRNLYGKLNLILITLLITLSFLPLLNRIEFLPSTISILTAFMIAGFATYQLATTRFIAIGLALMVPLTVVFPVHFILTPDMREILSIQDTTQPATPQIEVDKTPPIVMLVFDEFPQTDLLDANGKIDRKRFPNFAALADTATWYENATTVHDYTLKAVPAILTGNHPYKGSVLPLPQNYPNSIFNLLADEYNIHALEQATSLASSEGQRNHWRQNIATLEIFAGDLMVMYLHTVLPADLADTWFPMDKSLWGGFLNQPDLPGGKTILKYGEPERLRGWRMERMGHWENSDRLKPIGDYINNITQYPPETFHFIHILLPHDPFHHLPSGKLYNSNAWPPEPRYIDDGSVDFQPYADRRRHAHLLQVGLADTIVGRLMQTLKGENLFDQSIVVLVADHGINFKYGEDSRALSPQNLGSVGFVPLFIKFPDQTDGSIDSTNVQTIDIVPTILDTINAKNSPHFDGRSLLDNSSIPATKQIMNQDDKIFTFTEEEYRTARTHELADYIERFSLNHPKSSLFQHGPGLDFLDQNIETLKDNIIPATINAPGLEALRNIDLNANYIPLLISGTVSTPARHNPDTLIVAIAVNGTIEAIAQPFILEDTLHFSTILPEKAFLEETNLLEIILLPKTH